MAILLIADVQGHIDTSLGADELQRLIDAAEEDINAFLGPGAATYDEPTAVNELIRSQSHLLMLARPASEILTVVENGTTLAADDYELRSSGTTLRRLDGGTNSRLRWYGWVDVTYVPMPSTATKERVQLELIELAINFTPGATSERIGDWSETVSTASQDGTFEDQRTAILRTLLPVGAGIW